MSYRLESLNSKKTGAKPALKFKPKAVARKSKEDRDKNAALLKTEEKPRIPAPTRGRGGSRGRGGRGRGGSYGTQVIAAGPLASGSVGMGGTTSSKTGLTNDKIFGGESSLSASTITGLKLKSRASRSLTPFEEESDEDDDPSKINMSKEYAFEDSETTLFPVRPHKDSEPLVTSTTASVTVLANSSRAVTVDSVKSEGSDEVAPASIELNDPVARAEHDKIIDDQNAIVDLLTSNLADLKTGDNERPAVDDDKYLLFHIPQVMPKDHPEQAAASNFASTKNQNLEGEIGNLNFHKSGRITMTLGEGSVFDVTRGVSPSFLQEVFVLDSFEARRNPEDEAEEEMADILDVEGRKIGGDIYRLGEVAGKIIATPSFS